MIILVIQHQVNVAVFDNFRGDKLPLPPGGSKLWVTIERWCSWILPRDPAAVEAERKGHKLTSGPRRLLLAVMDFWLVFIAFSLIYWSFIPQEFSKCLEDYSLSLYFSIVAGTTLGFGEITPDTIRAQMITISETLTCFLFALTIIANTLSLLPRSGKLEK